MRPLIFISTYPPIRCGIATYTQQLIEALAKIWGGEILVIAPFEGEKISTPRISVKPAFKAVDEIPQAINSLQSFKPQIIHFQHDFNRYLPHRSFLGVVKVLSQNYPVCVTLHGILTKEGTFNFLEVEEFTRRLSRYAHLVVHTQNAKRVLSRMGVRDQQITVIPHGTPIYKITSTKKEFGFSQRDFLILKPGFLRERKEIDTVILAVNDLKRKYPDLRLLVVGDTHQYYQERKETQNYLAYCQKLIKENNLAKKVTFKKEFLSQEKLNKLVYSSDLVITMDQTNLYSVSGMVHLAVGALRPVIGLRVPKFYDEFTEFFTTELLINPGDFHQLALLIERIKIDKDYQKEILRLEKKFRQDTLWSKVAQRHVELYHHLSKLFFARGGRFKLFFPALQLQKSRQYLE